MNLHRPRRTPALRDTLKEKRYDTGRWKRLRKIVLDSAKHLCECDRCKQLPIPAIATHVDHIIQVTRGGSFWDIPNLQALSESCHQKKSAKERRR